MDYNPGSDFQQYLNAGERIVWTGKPKGGIRLQAFDLFLIPFSLVWCGFITFWILMALKTGSPVFLILFSVPFVLVGAYLLFGRFIMEARQRALTAYALTEERLLIISGRRQKTITSININALTGLEYSQKKDGSGTIMLHTSGESVRFRQRSSRLEMIPDVQQVYHQILNVQKRRQ